MIDCAYCERPLICESCRTPYMPPSQEHYEALSQPEVGPGLSRMRGSPGLPLVQDPVRRPGTKRTCR